MQDGAWDGHKRSSPGEIKTDFNIFCGEYPVTRV
jgi:hypothetical protein